MKSYTDEEILEVIKKLMNGEGDEEQLNCWFDNELYWLLPGISDIIFYSKEKLTPEEILKKARELSKPILL